MAAKEPRDNKMLLLCNHEYFHRNILPALRLYKKGKIILHKNNTSPQQSINGKASKDKWPGQVYAEST